MWGRIRAAEAWNAASFFSKPESSQGEERKKKRKKFLVVKTNKNDKASFKKMEKESRMLMIIRHAEIKMIVKKPDFNQGTTSGCFRGS